MFYSVAGERSTSKFTWILVLGGDAHMQGETTPTKAPNLASRHNMLLVLMADKQSKYFHASKRMIILRAEYKFLPVQ